MPKFNKLIFFDYLWYFAFLMTTHEINLYKTIEELIEDPKRIHKIFAYLKNIEKSPSLIFACIHYFKPNC